MNICFLSMEYPPETGLGGGIGTYTKSISHALARLGHNVHVVSYSIYENKEYEDDGVYVHRIGLDGHSYIIPSQSILPKTVSRLNYSFRICKRLQRLVGQYDIDIVEAPEWYAESLFASFPNRIRTPVVVRLHTPLFVINAIARARRPIDTVLASHLEIISMERATRLTSPSHSLANVVAKKLALRESSVRVIPNGIDPKSLSGVRDVEFRRKHGIAENVPLILFIGKLEYRKGVGLLAKAIPIIMSEVKDAMFAFVGKDTNTSPLNGSYKEYIRIVAREYTDRVFFTGFVTEDEKANAYRESDVLVFPSIYENFPYVLLEAASCACPIVAFKSGGIPEIIENRKSGLLASHMNSESLARAVIYMLKNPEEASRFGDSARNRVEENFGIQRTAELTLNFYEQVLTCT